MHGNSCTAPFELRDRQACEVSAKFSCPPVPSPKGFNPRPPTRKGAPINRRQAPLSGAARYVPRNAQTHLQPSRPGPKNRRLRPPGLCHALLWLHALRRRLPSSYLPRRVPRGLTNRPAPRRGVSVLPVDDPFFCGRRPPLSSASHPRVTVVDKQSTDGCSD